MKIGDKLYKESLLYKISAGENIEPLLKEGANPNQMLLDGFNSTPIHIACDIPHFESIKTLIRYKADVNAVSKGGHTPLMRLMKKGDVGLADFLLLSGAYINAKDDMDRTALWWASFYGQSEIIPLLVKKKANPNIADLSEGLSPLMVASRYADLKTVRALIKSGAEVNLVSGYGDTALTFSMLNKNKTQGVMIAEELIKAGADIHTRGIGKIKTKSLRPLVMAVKQQRLDMVKLLLKYRARGMAEALFYAKQKGNQDILNLLYSSAQSKDITFKNKEDMPLLLQSQSFSLLPVYKMEHCKNTIKKVLYTSKKECQKQKA